MSDSQHPSSAGWRDRHMKAAQTTKSVVIDSNLRPYGSIPGCWLTCLIPRVPRVLAELFSNSFLCSWTLLLTLEPAFTSHLYHIIPFKFWGKPLAGNLDLGGHVIGRTSQSPGMEREPASSYLSWLSPLPQPFFVDISKIVFLSREESEAPF